MDALGLNRRHLSLIHGKLINMKRESENMANNLNMPVGGFPEMAPTLRDRMAMAALTGFLANHHSNGDINDAALDAYKLADAMLAVREGK